MFSATAATPSPFHRLKPICVQLLSLASNTDFTAQHTTNTLTFCLHTLKTALSSIVATHSTNASSQPSPALSPSLVHYVFFPIAQLLRASPRGLNGLSDSIREVIFQVLAILASQWWYAWIDSKQATNPADWSVWTQLLILGVNAIGGSPTRPTETQPSQAIPSFSQETRLAAIEFLHQLLQVRVEGGLHDQQQSRKLDNRDTPSPVQKQQQESEWEWDGISELPSLDDVELADRNESSPAASTKDKAPASKLRIVYPTPAHVSYALSDPTAKGAVAFALTSCLDLSCQPSHPTELRRASLVVSHQLLTIWIAAAVASSPSGPNSVYQMSEYTFLQVDQASETLPVYIAAAVRLRPLIPGITSSLSRLISSRPKQTIDAQSLQLPTPGEVIAVGLDMLTDLLVLSLSDRTTNLLKRPPISEPDIDTPVSEGRPNQVSISKLEDFAAFIEQPSSFAHVEAATEGPNPSSSPTEAIAQHGDSFTTSPSAPTNGQEDERKKILSTFARVHLVIRTFSPLSTSYTAGHPVAQKHLANFATSLLFHMCRNLVSLDEQTVSSLGDDQDASSGFVQRLLTWIIDLAGEQGTTSVVDYAKSCLSKLLTDDVTLAPASSLLSSLSFIMNDALSQFPQSVTSQNDQAALVYSLRLSTLATFAHGVLSDPGRADRSHGRSLISHALQNLFGQNGGVETWGGMLISSIRIAEIFESNPSSANSGVNFMLQPKLDGLESSTSQTVLAMLSSFGQATAALAIDLVKYPASSNRERSSIKPNFDAFHALLFFIKQGSMFRSCQIDQADSTRLQGARNKSLVALMVASQMLQGVSKDLNDQQLSTVAGQEAKRLRKIAHKLGRNVFSLVIDILETDWDEVVEETSVNHQSKQQMAESNPHSSLVSTSTDVEMMVETVKGLQIQDQNEQLSEMPERFGPALNLSYLDAVKMPTSAARSAPKNPALALVRRAERAEKVMSMSNAMLFSLIGCCASLLGQSFRPLLLRGIYPIISGLASPHEFQRIAAEAALRQVAFSAAYASIQSCMLDHADYVLGAACQRLISGLGEELRAQFVDRQLLATARGGDSASFGTRFVSSDSSTKQVVVPPSAAASITPLLSAQRAPFVLLQMIKMLGSEVVPMVEDAIDEVMEALDRFHGYQTVCEGLLAVLEGILQVMALEEAETQVRRVSALPWKDGRIQNVGFDHKLKELRMWLKSTNQDGEQASGSAFDPSERNVDDDGEEEATNRTPTPPEKSDNPAATRSQQVVRQILDKSVAFLSHPSFFLRAKVLALLRYGVLVLGPQKREAELLPIVNSAWPLLMARLGRSYTNEPHLNGSSSKSTNDRILDLDTARCSVRQQSHQKHKKRSELESKLTETEPYVWIEAAKLVESLASQVPEFVGKKIVQDVWPRFQLLLQLLQNRFDPNFQNFNSKVNLNRSRISEMAVQTDPIQPTHPHQHRHHFGEKPFLLSSSTSVATVITQSILQTLTTTVKHLGVRLSDDIAWQISVDPTLLSTLDHRQPVSIQNAGRDLYIQLAVRNWDSVWFVLHASLSGQQAESRNANGGGTLQDVHIDSWPCWMRQDQLQVEINLVNSILASTELLLSR